MPGSWATSAGTAAVVFGSMLLEARRAARNERAQRARGGIEPPGDVYQVMQVVYPGAFLAMLAEGRGAWRFATGRSFRRARWCSRRPRRSNGGRSCSLGPFWTFRVIVVPGAALVSRGPYRWLRHPNYVGVLGELAGVAAITGAPLSGVARDGGVRGADRQADRRGGAGASHAWASGLPTPSGV